MKTTLGITGGMGSGKSHICSIFKKFGVPVYDSDSRVKDLLNSNDFLKYMIKKKFGKSCYKDGKWNRNHVVELASANPNIIDEMGIIIEPYLVDDFREFKGTYQSGNLTGYYSEIIVIESAILYKSKLLMDEIDNLLVVSAPLETRMDRIRKRDPFRTEPEIKMLLDRQNFQIPFCEIDFTIDNDGTKNIEEAVQTIIDRLTTKIKGTI